VFLLIGYRQRMTDPSDTLTPADLRDLDDALAFAPGVDAERPLRRAAKDDPADEQESPPVGRTVCGDVRRPSGICW
jgi:hypothetical protein